MSSPPPPSLLNPELPDGVEPSPPAGAPEPPGLRAVPVWAPFVALLAAFLLLPSVVYTIGAGIKATGVIPFDFEDPGFVIPSTLLLDAGFVLCAFATVRIWASPVRPSALGFRTIPFRRGLAWAAGIYAAFWVLTGIYSVVIGQGPQQELVDELRNQRSLIVLGGYAVLVGLAAPLAEETLFRGLLYGVLREKLGVPFAALLAGSLFGLVHAGGTPVRLLGVLVMLGIALCVLYEKTGSLLPGMAVHSLHNSLSFGATKGLAWWGVLLLMAGSVTIVLLVARAVASREPALARGLRPSPAPA